MWRVAWHVLHGTESLCSAVPAAASGTFAAQLAGSSAPATAITRPARASSASTGALYTFT